MLESYLITGGVNNLPLTLGGIFNSWSLSDSGQRAAGDASEALAQVREGHVWSRTEATSEHTGGSHDIVHPSEGGPPRVRPKQARWFCT